MARHTACSDQQTGPALHDRGSGVPRDSNELRRPGFGLTLHADTLDQPQRWRKPRRIFVNSMSDLFHAKVPLAFIRDVFAVIAETPQHTYQVLTKRALRMRRLSDQLDWPANLWMGVSVEDQGAADLRVPDLLRTPAAVRFLSCEPLLGPLNLDWCDGVSALVPDWTGGPGGGTGAPHPLIDWVIVGGESGPDVRPVSPEWVRSIRDQCEYARVPFFFKQWGGRTSKSGGRMLDGRTWDEYPTSETVRR